MKLVIVGGGLAGTMAAKTLRELDRDVEIEIFGEEPYPYYPRPNLIEYLAGRMTTEKLFAFPPEWAEKQRIGLHPGEKVVKVRAEDKTIETASGASVRYGALLLATGARAAVPPIAGITRPGVFVLRTLDDAKKLIEHLGAHKRAVVLGGGLLGLEIARAIRNREAEVTVVEFFDRLLPRQLDPAAAAILKAQFEAAGIRIRLSATAQEVFGDDGVGGLRFASGPDLEGDSVIVAAGIKPEIGAAVEAGLDVGKGIIVDDRLRTSAPGIFAAGDVAEHKSRIYGIIPAAFEQARTAAYSMLGQDKSYPGTMPFNTLKVAGLYLTSVGEIDTDEPGVESFVRSNPEAGLYKKIVVQNGRLIGAIWMGTKKGASEISRLVAAKKSIAPLNEQLLKDDFDFSELI